MKKAFDIVRTVLVWLVVVVAVAMTVFTFFSLTTLNRYDRALFGYKIFIVNSDSMQATDFKAGDLIFIKDVDPETLQTGDIITFVSKDKSSLDETLTHKIRIRVTDSKGNPGFITYGTSTNTDDETIVLYKDVIGKYEFHIAGLGSIFNFLKTTAGFFLCIFTPIMLVIIYEIINFFVLLRKSKKEELKELEKKQMSNEELTTELRILKAQLEEKQLALSRPTKSVSISRVQKGIRVGSSKHPHTAKKVVVKAKSQRRTTASATKRRHRGR